MMATILAFFAAGSVMAEQPLKPHILFFMGDDVGWHNVEWHNSDMKTPHAVELLKQGIELDRHYAFPVCSPSRSSLMTGRLPIHVQQVNRQNCDLHQGAPRNMTFISAKLKQAGYETYHIGKWHLGCSSWGHIPKGRGFDHSLVYFAGAQVEIVSVVVLERKL
jgi:arylsulfatase I/J